jgi:hypothetical protein
LALYEGIESWRTYSSSRKERDEEMVLSDEESDG